MKKWLFGLMLISIVLIASGFANPPQIEQDVGIHKQSVVSDLGLEIYMPVYVDFNLSERPAVRQNSVFPIDRFVAKAGSDKFNSMPDAHLYYLFLWSKSIGISNSSKFNWNYAGELYRTPRDAL